MALSNTPYHSPYTAYSNYPATLPSSITAYVPSARHNITTSTISQTPEYFQCDCGHDWMGSPGESKSVCDQCGEVCYVETDDVTPIWEVYNPPRLSGDKSHNLYNGLKPYLQGLVKVEIDYSTQHCLLWFKFYDKYSGDEKRAYVRMDSADIKGMCYRDIAQWLERELRAIGA